MKFKDNVNLDELSPEIVKKNITLPYFCGMLQADGNISIRYCKDGWPTPRIILSQKDACFLKGIKLWLKEEHKISSYFQTAKTGVVNLIIDRKQCKDLITLINNASENLGMPLFLDRKLRDFYLVQESLAVNKAKLNAGPNSAVLNDFRSLQVAFIEEIKRNRVGPKGLSFKELCQRLKVENFNEAVGPIEISRIDAEATDQSRKLYESLVNKTFKPIDAFEQFMLGVIDGDGSISVGLVTVGYQKDPQSGIDCCVETETSGLEFIEDIVSLTPAATTKHARPFRFSPGLLLSGQRGDSAYLFQSIAFHLSGSNIYSHVTVVDKSNSELLALRGLEYFKLRVLPFFKRNPPVLSKNLHRLGVFKTVVQALPEVYQNLEACIQLTEYIYETDLYERSKTLDEYVGIIKKHFK